MSATERTAEGQQRVRRGHRWLAGGVTLALLAGAAGFVLLRRAPALPPAATPATTWPQGDFDTTLIDCSAPSDVWDEMGHLPDGFGPIRSAYLCRTVDRKVPGDGVWQYQVVRRITGDLGRLQAVLEAADEAPTSGSCTAEFFVGPPIWVVGSHSAALVRVPLDACAHAVDNVVDEVLALPATKVSDERLQRVESQTALDSGCSESFKDLLRIQAADGGTPRGASPPQLDPSTRWTVCRYRVVQRDGDVSTGTLESADRLTAGQLAAVDDALRRSTVDPTCRRDDHTRFATITGDGDWIDVALDGCAVQHGTSWWRADRRLRDLLS